MEKSNIEQKNARRTDGIDYKSASLIVYGAVCAVLMVNNIAGWRLDFSGHSELPGFWAMSNLCSPILVLLVGFAVEVLETESEVVDAADCRRDIHIWSLRLFGFRW